MSIATPTDGRTQRRERGRRAVVDAVIDLVAEGHAPPTAEQVAERAGVSPASLFRYFATVEEMREAGIRRWFERYVDLLAIPDIGVGSLSSRIEGLVAARIRYHETAEPMIRLARRQAFDVPAVRATIERVRATVQDQLLAHFDPELRPLRPAVRAERVAVVAVVTSFDAWDHLRVAGLDPVRTARVMRRSVRELLGAPR